MKCPNCNFINQIGSRFCSQCGTKLNQQCTCGANDIPLDANFCPICGVPLNNQSTTPLEQGLYTVNGVSFKMVKIEGGTFLMGETVVTQELWHAVMKNNPSSIVGAQHPVIDISWDDTQLFIKKLNKITGESFRLPTQAEWEFAACGGYKSKNHKYAGSDNIDEVAWYKDNSTKTIHPVKQKKPNEVGLFDMNGNVWEYCEEHKDNFWETYFTVAGGSYESNERKCRLPATRTFSIVATATSLRLTLSVKV